MLKQNLRMSLSALLLLSPMVLAYPIEAVKIQGDYTQSIQIVNLLANNTLPDPGMTPTTFIVKYYNGSAYPCWYATLNYHDDYTVHAGPNLGCREKVDRVEITPNPVAEKLRTYQPGLILPVDTSKFLTQITIVQGAPPLFDANNGMVIQSGTMQARIQSQLHRP